MIVKTDFLMQIENVLGALVYFIGVAGSYFRFGRYERRGKLDALFMICITWGYCTLMIGVINIVKYILVPSLHVEVIRLLYFGAAFASSLIFFDKDFKSAATKNKIAAALLMGGMAFVFGEALVFYLDLPYGMAVLSCVGLLWVYIFSLFEKKNMTGILTGLIMLMVPILPTLAKKDLNIDKMRMKREVAVKKLIENRFDWDNEEKRIAELSK